MVSRRAVAEFVILVLYTSSVLNLMHITVLLILTKLSIFSLLPANGACGWCNRGVSSNGNSFNISYGNFDRFHPSILDTLMFNIRVIVLIIEFFIFIHFS